MDGPISTSESAGSAQQAGSVPVRTPSVGPPEKVAPVSEGSRSRSSRRHEVGLPGKEESPPPVRDRKAGERGTAETQGPAYFVELGPAEPGDSARRTSGGSPREAAEPPGRQEDAGGPSQPARYNDLADSLAAAKERWVEVNQEALEATALPGQGEEEEAEGNEATKEATARYSPSVPDPSRYDALEANRDAIHEPRFSPPADRGSTTKPQNRSAPPWARQDETVSSAVQCQLATPYQSFAMALSNPHQTRPIIDLFV